MTTERTPSRSIEELTDAARHATALMASGVLTAHERGHLTEASNCIADAVARKSREEPKPLRGPADVQTA